MGLRQFIGITFIALVWLWAGTGLLLEPQKFIDDSGRVYPKVHQWLQKSLEVKLPEFLSPATFIKYSPTFVKWLGIAEVVLAFGIFFRVKHTSLPIAISHSIIVFIFSNPFIETTDSRKFEQFLQWILSIGVVGTLLLAVKDKPKFSHEEINDKKLNIQKNRQK